MKLSLILIFWGGEFDYKALNLKLKELKNLTNTPDIWEKPEAKQYFKSIYVSLRFKVLKRKMFGSEK